MRAISFVVPGAVVGKGRPKFARVGAHVRTYTPAGTTSYENLIKHAAAAAMVRRTLLSCPCKLAIVAHVDVPTSWPAWKRDAALEGLVMPTVKPDFDNLIKIVADALNKVVWTDDTVVVREEYGKDYAPNPGLLVSITPLRALPAQSTRRTDLTALLNSGAAA